MSEKVYTEVLPVIQYGIRIQRKRVYTDHGKNNEINLKLSKLIMIWMDTLELKSELK